MDPFEYKNSKGNQIEIGDRIQIQGRSGSHAVIFKKKMANGISTIGILQAGKVINIPSNTVTKVLKYRRDHAMPPYSTYKANTSERDYEHIDPATIDYKTYVRYMGKNDLLKNSFGNNSRKIRNANGDLIFVEGINTGIPYTNLVKGQAPKNINNTRKNPSINKLNNSKTVVVLDKNNNKIEVGDTVRKNKNNSEEYKINKMVKRDTSVLVLLEDRKGTVLRFSAPAVIINSTNNNGIEANRGKYKAKTLTKVGPRYVVPVPVSTLMPVPIKNETSGLGPLGPTAYTNNTPMRNGSNGPPDLHLYSNNDNLLPSVASIPRRPLKANSSKWIKSRDPNMYGGQNKTKRKRRV